MRETIVVSLRHTDQYDIYIGRSMRGTLRHLVGQGWGNYAPTLDEYERHLRAKLDRDVHAQQRFLALRGKRLACWCAPPEGLTHWNEPLICHGQVLLKLIDELERATPRRLIE